MTIADLTPAERAIVRGRAAWRRVARPEQLPPETDWHLWLLRGGRGSGKTRSGAEWIADELLTDGDGDVSAIVAPTYGEGRDKCVEGVSGLKPALERRGIAPRWNRTNGELWLPSGAKVIVDEAFTGAVKVEGENLRRAWCDEVRNWRPRWGEQAWDRAIRYAVRVSPAQIVATTTLRPTPLVKQLLAEADATAHMTTYDNRENLDESWFRRVTAQYEGTRLGRQELLGHLLEDVEGALWRQSMIDAARVDEVPRELWRRRVVGLDPADGTEAGAEQALVVAGLNLDNFLYVLRSEGMRGRAWDYLWRAVDVALEHEATIVVEKNHGGEYLVEVLEQVMRHRGVRVPYRVISAGKGKLERAEPVAALYEQGRVRHVGPSDAHAELEAQMTTYTGAPGERSPDRMDALVHALRDLMGLSTGSSSSGGGAVPYTTERVPGGAVPWR